MIDFRSEPFNPSTEFDEALFYVDQLQKRYEIPVMTEGDVVKLKESILPRKLIRHD